MLNLKRKKMNKIVEKTKDLLIGKQELLTKDAANMIAHTGKECTIEQRFEVFTRETNEVILSKARTGQYVYLMQTPEELYPLLSKIKEHFASRGFKVHSLNPDIFGTFVISWK